MDLKREVSLITALASSRSLVLDDPEFGEDAFPE